MRRLMAVLLLSSQALATVPDLISATPNQILTMYEATLTSDTKTLTATVADLVAVGGLALRRAYVLVNADGRSGSANCVTFRYDGTDKNVVFLRKSVLDEALTALNPSHKRLLDMLNPAPTDKTARAQAALDVCSSLLQLRAASPRAATIEHTPLQLPVGEPTATLLGSHPALALSPQLRAANQLLTELDALP